ncbi:hypothetical protein AB0L41_46540 [Amycolatopsis mediterranei]|uniref:hypothetical protein n=1 Tax=Amycolatopsis mediterranei TaxID=33910 RepID=UPI00343D86D4
MITTRTARAEDEAVLARIDERTWTPAVSPAPAPPPGTPFFDDGTRPEDVLVAEHGGAVAGYVRLGEGFGIPAHRHVAVLGGLASTRSDSGSASRGGSSTPPWPKRGSAARAR